VPKIAVNFPDKGNKVIPVTIPEADYDDVLAYIEELKIDQGRSSTSGMVRAIIAKHLGMSHTGLYNKLVKRAKRHGVTFLGTYLKMVLIQAFNKQQTEDSQ